MVVDEHRTVAELFEVALSARPDVGAVLATHDAEEAVAQLDSFEPAAVLVDARAKLSVDDGPGAEIRAAAPQAAVVVLVGVPSAPVVRAALHAGAVQRPEARRPPRGARRRGRRRPRARRIHPDLVHVLVDDGPVPMVMLTPREEQVLQRLSDGQSPAAISRELGVSLGTTRGHVKSVLQKLGAHSQLEAVSQARRLGLLHDIQSS